MKPLTPGFKRALQLPLMLTLLALIGACQAASEPVVPQQQAMKKMQGVLVLKGNVPHTVPMLQTEQGNWELVGADGEQVKRLQRQRVVVTGHTIAGEPPQRPRLQVERIDPLPAQ